MQIQLEEIVNKYLYQENSDITRFYIKKDLDSFLSGEKFKNRIKDFSVDPVPFEKDHPSKLSINVSITQRNKKILIFCLSISATNFNSKNRKSPKTDKYF